MTQVNKVNIFKTHQFKAGDKVTCEFYPDTIWTIISIDGKSALIRSKGNIEKAVSIRRLRMA